MVEEIEIKVDDELKKDKKEEVEEDEECAAASEPKPIDPKDWEVSVRGCCGGGGTGLEFYPNLKKPGNDYGNKWLDSISSETWIKAVFNDKKTGQFVRMISLKSANDCPERDPAKIEFYGKTFENKNKDFELLSEEDDVVFEDRYQFLDFYIPADFYSEIKIVFKQNKFFKDNKYQGACYQLNELVFYK